MSNAIKFRAWDNHLKEYSTEEIFISSNGDVFLPINGWDLNGNEAYEGRLEIEQFTGFTDESNTPIYQGDIVIDNYNRKMLVVFREHKQTLEFKALTKTNFKYAELHEWTENKDIDSGDMTLMVKLIGNIRQHKHLLED